MLRKTPKAERIKINVVGSSTFGVFPKISTEVTYNMFMSDDWLINMPGYQKVQQILPQGEGRGLFVSVRGGIMVAVVNNSVYAIDANLSTNFIGNIATTIGEVSIDENLNGQICIADGMNLYIYNRTLPPALTVQTGLPLGLVPGFVSYHNTFFLIGNINTLQTGASWYAASNTAPTTIGNYQAFTLQTKPDFPLAVIRIPSQSANVLVIGTSICEVWTQIGGLQNYRRNNTISVDFGCIATDTIASSDEYIAFLGVNQTNSPVITIYSGQGAKSISTDGIDYLLAHIKFPQNATAMFVRYNGHLFYQLTFWNPVDNLTLLYDFKTDKFYHFSDGDLNYHPAQSYGYFNNQTYFLSLNNCSLYITSQDLSTYNENLPSNQNPDPTINLEIPRVRICAPVQKEDSATFIANSFVITVEQGQDQNYSGINFLNFLITEPLFLPDPNDYILTEWGEYIVDEQPSSVPNHWPFQLPGQQYLQPYVPRIDCSISTDGGIDYSNDVPAFLQPTGYRRNVVTWDKMGYANDLTIRLRFWGMSRFVCHNGYLDIY